MVEFGQNQIFSEKEEILKQLSLTRKEKDLTLDEIAKEIGIDKKYLEALETGEYNKLPEGVYAKKFLKEYVVYLGLDYSDFIDVFEKPQSKKQTKEGGFFSNKVVGKHSFIIFPKILKNILIIIAVIICFVYLGFYLGKIISPPELEIITPNDNIVISENFIDVSGKTKKETEITINGESVLPDEQGFFSKQINLKKGLNTIIIVAQKKFGKEKVIKKQVLVN